jgi:hypothetical protein
MTERYLALNLTPAARQAVLARFVPRFDTVRCDHVTLAYGVALDCQLPAISRVVVVAYVCDEGLEALIVSVNGKQERDDGSIYHLTLSRASNRKSVESNQLAADKSLWQPLSAFELEVVCGVNQSGLSI